MADKAPLFAQFDGDEIDGKVYPLGKEIDASVSAGTLEYLKSIGRIGFAKPSTPIMVPPADTPIEDMDRAQLEATALSMVDLSSMSDDDLRDKIAGLREGKAKDSENAAYDAIKDKPLSTLKTSDLEIVASVEGVDISGLTNNPERAKAIQAARDAE